MGGSLLGCRLVISAWEIFFHQGKCKQLANLSEVNRKAREGPESFYLQGKNAFMQGKLRAIRGSDASGNEHSWCEFYILELKECRPA